MEEWARRCRCGHGDAHHDDFGACAICECDAFDLPGSRVVRDQFATLATMARDIDTMSEDGLRRRMDDIADLAERWARSSAGADR